MTNQIFQEIDQIIDGLGAASWEEVKEEFHGSTIEEITKVLEHMFSDGSDEDNTSFAERIHDAVLYYSDIQS